ncbi:unnamed protein product [Parascedosporium putredinis]|uniref:Nibrin second BRCT domain-containing protein n=1 Tax=Parascedosporium putredinis TaxID=1442378 RepID=A0A9P1HB61_9PEZI|nr:unnamed protein product [Parascedosporium putredinis]CAI8003376.1 unnamed protein product [Parascedosporium putredinis]
MWVLDSSGPAFQGRKLWLRPGKRYLIGRTSSEAGQLVITHKTISRKHLSITVDAVPEGDACFGSITWVPVVLTYSFTSRELQNNPLETLRTDLEQLDIKFITEYNIKATTHVVSKKRNTSKGLQALINGKYIVSGSFTDSIIAGATIQEGDESPLEVDFAAAWPNEIDYLPPRGSEATQNPASQYTPDPLRKDVFDGYTFVFYDKAQWNNLLAPITNGKGKALYFEVLDHRPIEQKEFLEAILSKDASTLRRPLPLADRPVEHQAEASSVVAQSMDAASAPADSEMADSAHTGTGTSQEPSQADQNPSAPAPAPVPARRGRGRKPATKRFKGFDLDDDDDIPSIPESVLSAPVGPPSTEEQKPVIISRDDEEEGLFVSQGSVMASQDTAAVAQPATRKRRGRHPHDEDDVMDDIAPTAAAAKRRRIAMGEDPLIREETPDTMDVETQPKKAEKPKKIKKEIDVLEVARKSREEAEARARAEQEDLNKLPEDIDLAEIRKLAIVEEMTVRVPPGARSREQDIADGRWDPKWNGRKNFKKFRTRGEAMGRPTNRNIISLVQVKSKEFGIGDDYWLEDESGATRNTSQATGPSQPSRGDEASRAAPAPTASGQTRTQSSLGRAVSRRTVVSEDSDDDDDGDDNNDVGNGADDHISLGISGLEHGGADAEPDQGVYAAQEAAPAAPVVEQLAKRPRQTRRAAAAAESEDEDSDEEVGFKFGRRR